MPRSTYMTFLMKKSSTGDTYEKLVDIKSFPDLGGEPEMLETTTLSDEMQTYILGIQSLDALTFNANYDLDKYTALKELENETNSYAVWLGGTKSGNVLTPTGSAGKYKFDGQLSVFVAGGEVNQVVNMTISIAPSTPIVLDETV